MYYHVDCKCGESVLVPDTAAGSTAPCRCGAVVPIPSLRELRRQAGEVQPELAPEAVVEAMLLARKLPEEKNCVLCGVTTQATVCCRIECERAQVYYDEPTRWGCAFGVVGALLTVVLRQRATEARETGKDRIFSLPLRVCAMCRQELTSPRAVKEALCRVPLYRRLFDKFPKAQVSLLT